MLEFQNVAALLADCLFSVYLKLQMLYIPAYKMKSCSNKEENKTNGARKVRKRIVSTNQWIVVRLFMSLSQFELECKYINSIDQENELQTGFYAILWLQKKKSTYPTLKRVEHHLTTV